VMIGADTTIASVAVPITQYVNATTIIGRNSSTLNFTFFNIHRDVK